MATAPVALVNVSRQSQNVFERSPLFWCSLPRACFAMPVNLAILVRLISIMFFMPECLCIFFFFFLQLGKVGLSKTFHFILYWWYSAGTMLHHRFVTNCLFTVVTFVPSLHILLTLTIDLIAKVYNYFKKYYRYKNWIHCFCCYIPGKLGCSEQARLVESINIDQNNVSLNPKFILFAYYEWHNF